MVKFDQTSVFILFFLLTVLFPITYMPISENAECNGFDEGYNEHDFQKALAYKNDSYDKWKFNLTVCYEIGYVKGYAKWKQDQYVWNDTNV